jgi:hypothetical protein
MKMPRKTSARMIPTSSASCWYLRGTRSAPIRMMNTNRLSIERLYSVSHPV